MKFQHPNIKTNFKLYQSQTSKLESSIFDLIDGDKETKQTKGLAYLIKLDKKIIERILSMSLVSSRVKELLGDDIENLRKTKFIQVDAEMLSEAKDQDGSPVRRDITITFYYRDEDRHINEKIFAIIIEAKSAKLKNVGNIEEQLDKYFKFEYYPDDYDIPKLGITLTKYRQVFDDNYNKFVSITWAEIIEIINDEIRDKSNEALLRDILTEYYNFITGVDKDMKFYEKEVLSVAAGKTFDIINKYNIHACPSSYSYKTPIYITFRNKGGGSMDTLYKIDDILLLNPNNGSYKTMLENSNFEYSERLLGYIEERKSKWMFEKSEDYRFYILSETEQITLKHHPKPKANNTGARYYSFAELLSGEPIVGVVSGEDEIGE